MTGRGGSSKSGGEQVQEVAEGVKINDCAGGGKRLEMVYNFMVLRVSAVLLMCQITIPDKAQNEEASSNKIKVSTPYSA